MSFLFRIIEMALIVWYYKNYGLVATLTMSVFTLVMVLDYRLNYEE